MEEDRQKKEEASRAHLKQRQLNEMRYAYINSIKIHNQWRKIMRLAKVEDLRKEIEILSQNHEREVDRKDAIIQMLDRDLVGCCKLKPALKAYGGPGARGSAS
jgi:hypothetical protein